MNGTLKSHARNWPYPERELSLNTKKQLALVNVLPISIKPYSLGMFATYSIYSDDHAGWYLQENERELHDFFEWAILENDLAIKRIQNQALLSLANEINGYNRNKNYMVLLSDYVIGRSQYVENNSGENLAYLEYVKDGIQKPINETVRIGIHSKAFADALLFEDEKAFQFLIPANNYPYSKDTDDLLEIQ